MEALVHGWLPPSRQNWELIVYSFQFFPIFTAIQWLTTFYPQGKTSVNSKFNLPGKWAWAIMESPGPIILLYCMFTISKQEGIESLPIANWTMASLYTMHYLYRAWIAPMFLNPSMSPIHPLVFIFAAIFNTVNGLSFGGWLGGYGPKTDADWAGRLWQIMIGMIIWGWSFMGNIFHDDDLREIRRSAAKRQKAKAEKEGKPVEGVEKLYMLPKNGLFHFVFFAHYLCEWIEWGGFWLMGGKDCLPARNFLINEISTMLPRALQGKEWYEQRFTKEEINNRKAVIPGLL